MLKKYAAFIILFVALAWLIAPAFETIDDFFMVQIVSGKYGHHPSDLMLYSSAFYGKVLVLMYHVIPSVNWYFLFFLLAHLISWLIIMDVLFKYNTHYYRLSILLFIYLFSTFGLYFLGSLQFTTTAFILGLSGLLLILNKKNNPAIILGIILVLWACLIRYYSVLLLGGLVLPWFFYKWVLHDGILNILKYKKSILIVLGLVLMAVLIKESGKSIYRQTESGKTLRSFIYERGFLIDNPSFVYTPANYAAFKDAGWTKEDFKIFSDYYFDPSPPFNGERLIYIWTHLKIAKPDQTRIVNGFNKLFSQYQVYALLLLLISSGVLNNKISRKDIFFLIFQSGAILLFLAYLLFYNDFKQRVIIPLFFIASLCIVMHILRETSSAHYTSGKFFPYIYYSIVIFIAIVLFFNYEAMRERRSNDFMLKRQFAIINNIKKDWLVVHGYDLPIENATLRLINDRFDLKGKVYFTMPSYLMHYLTGSKQAGKHQSSFDLLCNNQQTIVLMHDEKTTSVSEVLNYAGLKSGNGTPGYTKIVYPGLAYDLYLIKKQDVIRFR
jgi:hypothetical protein